MQRYGGISRYFANLYESVLESKDFKATLGVRVSDNYYIENYMNPFQKFLKRKIAKKEPTFQYNEKFSLKLLQKGIYDIYHPTYYNTYAINVIRMPMVVTVHDMIHEIFPQYYSIEDLKDSENKKILAQRADKIIAISLSTKMDLMQLFNIPDDKIEVIYHGYKPTVAQNVKSAATTLPYENYILFVGERIRYKNFDGLMKAFVEIAIKFKTLNLVCAGGGTFTDEEMESFKKMGLTSRIFHISASDIQLNQLYKNALLFVFPSLYEGFGLPMLEAFANNCPVAASNTSSFSEVGADAIAYFDPYNPENIKEVILNILEDQDLSNDLRSKGQKQLNKFSMKACTQKTLHLYKSLATKQ